MEHPRGLRSAATSMAASHCLLLHACDDFYVLRENNPPQPRLVFERKSGARRSGCATPQCQNALQLRELPPGPRGPGNSKEALRGSLKVGTYLYYFIFEVGK